MQSQLCAYRLLSVRHGVDPCDLGFWVPYSRLQDRPGRHFIRNSGRRVQCFAGKTTTLRPGRRWRAAAAGGGGFSKEEKEAEGKTGASCAAQEYLRGGEGEGAVPWIREKAAVTVCSFPPFDGGRHGPNPGPGARKSYSLQLEGESQPVMRQARTATGCSQAVPRRCW